MRAWEHPAVSGPLERAFACVEGGAPSVIFAVPGDTEGYCYRNTRNSHKSFFDYRVHLAGFLCRAHVNCVEEDGGPALLLRDETGARARTVVLSVSCDSDYTRDRVGELALEDVSLECDGNDAPELVIDVTRDQASSTGSLCKPGALDGCPALTARPGFDPDGVLFQVAEYHGQQSVPPLSALYWNVALGVRDGISSCTLRARATIDDPLDDQDGFVDGAIASHAWHPVVAFDVDLGACGRENLGLGLCTDDAPVGLRASRPEGERFPHRIGEGGALVGE